MRSRNYGIAQLPRISPSQLHSLEINQYARQLAQVAIWIRYLQWLRDNGFSPDLNPVLAPIETIQWMDAILDLSDPENPKEPEWPEAEFIVGNPPFLGGNKIRIGLGDLYVDQLFATYQTRIPAFADLCCYWFEKARAMRRNQEVATSWPARNARNPRWRKPRCPEEHQRNWWDFLRRE